MTHRTSEAPLAVELTGPLSHALLARIGDQWCWKNGKEILCASSEIGLETRHCTHTFTSIALSKSITAERFQFSNSKRQKGRAEVE